MACFTQSWYEEKSVIDEAKDSFLIPEWYEYIEAIQVREAFIHIVGLSAVVRDFRCHAQRKGEVRDYRFYAQNNEQWFALIPNKNWLLFYIRKPAVNSDMYDFHSFEAAFDSVTKKPTGEWTIRIRCIDDVRRLWSLLHL